MSLVVKIGGSLYSSSELKCWLQTLADHSIKQSQSIIIVPGGGPFADQVRHAQKKHGINDQIAHHMAIVAMKQYGLMLHGLEKRCRILPESLNNIYPLSIWLPDDSLLKEKTIEQNWNISSDSLSLWLANKVSAQQLILIKRSTCSSHSIAQLTAENILDTGFANLFTKTPVKTKIIHYQQQTLFTSLVLRESRDQSLVLP